MKFLSPEFNLILILIKSYNPYKSNIIGLVQNKKRKSSQKKGKEK